MLTRPALVGDRGVTSKRALREALGTGSPAVRGASLDRALLELESRLQLVTVDYSEKEGAFFDLFARAHRSLAVRAARRGRAESLERIVGRYVRSAVVVEPARVAEMLRGLAGAGEVRAAVDALLAAGRLGCGSAAGQGWLVARG